MFLNCPPKLVVRLIEVGKHQISPKTVDYSVGPKAPYLDTTCCNVRASRVNKPQSRDLGERDT